MLKNTLVKTAAAAVLLSSLSGLTAFAQTADSTPKPQIAKVEKPQKVVERCEIGKQRLQEAITRQQERKVSESKKMDKLTEEIAKRAAKGADVTKLSADKSTLEEKLAIVQQDHDAIIAALNTSLQTSCSADNATLKTTLQTFSQQLKTLRLKLKTDRQSVLNFYKHTVRPDLQTTKPQATVTPKV
ncbi:MAG: hypothetical protein WCP97_05015 [bacterium]